jgi:hypothetical protein
MVRPGGGSRPATLSQRQVDEFGRGEPSEEAKQLLRTTHFESTAKQQAVVGKPISLEVKEIQEIVRCGTSPESVCKRIAIATVPAEKMEKEALKGNVPTLKPPESAERN